MSARPDFANNYLATRAEDSSQTLSELDKVLLNNFQHDFPLSRTPFKDIADKLGISEDDVIQRYQSHQETGIISRIGPVIRANTVGVSTLVAMTVPEHDVERVAFLINAFAEVNHNYEREHDFNIWFVVTASKESHLAEVLASIEQQTGYSILNLPLLEAFHIDLGFELQWNS